MFFHRLAETEFLNAIGTTAMSHLIIGLIKPTVVFTTTGLTFNQFSALFRDSFLPSNRNSEWNLLSLPCYPVTYFAIRFVILFEFRLQWMKSIDQTAITLTNWLLQQILVFWNEYCQKTSSWGYLYAGGNFSYQWSYFELNNLPQESCSTLYT